MTSDNVLVKVENLKMYFPVTAGVMRRKVGDVKAVDGVTFDVRRGETLGLVGESGCGKTTTGRCILRLYDITEGKIVFEGQDLAKIAPNELRGMRRNMQLIFKDRYASLAPRMTAGNIVGEPMIVHNLVKGKEYQEQVDELFKLVQLAPYMTERFPHEFSGGQRQRIR